MIRRLAILFLCLGFLGCSMFNDENDCCDNPTGPGYTPFMTLAVDLVWCGNNYYEYHAQATIHGARTPAILKLDWGDGWEDTIQGTDLERSHGYTSCGNDIGSGGHGVGWLIRATAVLDDGTPVMPADEEVNPCATCS